MTTWQRSRKEMSGYFQMYRIPWCAEDRETRWVFYIKSWKREDACHKAMGWSGRPPVITGQFGAWETVFGQNKEAVSAAFPAMGIGNNEHEPWTAEKRWQQTEMHIGSNLPLGAQTCL